MNRELFAERFTVPPVPTAEVPVEGAVYEVSRSYTVAASGIPLVNLAVADNTTTMTFVESESADSDREWEPSVASLDTVTRARVDRDHWSG